MRTKDLAVTLAHAKRGEELQWILAEARAAPAFAAAGLSCLARLARGLGHARPEAMRSRRG
jgi:hypothetical protein